MQPRRFKIVVIVGPESTGKSTLARLLAEHYNSVHVQEYARTYLNENGVLYGYEDLAKIAVGQMRAEDEAIEAHMAAGKTTPVFLDTDMNVIKVWSEYVYDVCESNILTAVAERTYDLYLVCNTDVPWVKDEMREYPDLETREKLFHYYKQLAISLPAPFKIIAGGYEERLQNAILFTDQLMAGEQ